MPGLGVSGFQVEGLDFRGSSQKATVVPCSQETAPPTRTLQEAHAEGPMVVLGGVRSLMSEVPL